MDEAIEVSGKRWDSKKVTLEKMNARASKTFDLARVPDQGIHLGLLFFEQKGYQVAADKSRAAGDQNPHRTDSKKTGRNGQIPEICCARSGPEERMSQSDSPGGEGHEPF